MELFEKLNKDKVNFMVDDVKLNENGIHQASEEQYDHDGDINEQDDEQNIILQDVDQNDDDVITNTLPENDEKEEKENAKNAYINLRYGCKNKLGQILKMKKNLSQN